MRIVDTDSHSDRIIPLSLLFIVSMIIMLESSQWSGKNFVRSTGKKNTPIPRGRNLRHFYRAPKIAMQSAKNATDL